MGFFKSHSTSRAEKINNFQATICEYGTPVQDIVGTVKTNPNVINWKDFYAKEVRTTQKSGKHKHTDISYRYYVYLELALSETVTDLGKVWCGSKEYSSLREANNSDAEGFPLLLHKDGGKSEFMASTYPEQAVDYKNLAYLCSKGNKWNGTFLGENMASVPSYSFEVKGQLLNTGDGIDVNPADYFLYLLKRVGIYNGTDPEEAIIEGIGNFRNYCTATNLYVSSKPSNSQKPVHDLIEDLCELLDVYFFWSDDKFKIVVKDDREYSGWKPNKTVVFDLNNNDFLPQNNGAGVIFSRKTSSDIFNRFTLSYMNRENHYEEESVSYEFPDDVKERGLNQKGTIDGHWFYSKERAIKVVEIQARKNKREQNKYKFALDWAYAVLEPGDLVTLTDPACGLNKQIAMVESVIEAEDGVIQVEALQYSDGEYPAAIINPSPDKDNFFDYNIEPSATAGPYIFQPPSAATLTGNELWIAMKGTDSTWGGANIYLANQDQNYQFLAQHRQSAQYGQIVASVSADADSFTARINGDFENMTLEDAQNGNSMFYLDGECISYQTATINLDGTWTFSGLVRGQYSTDPSYHEAGTTAVYCDGSIYTIELSKKDFNRTVFFRFPSVNVFAACGQDVSEATPYSYYISEYFVPSVQNINAYTRYISTENAVSYSIQVEWTPPELDTYSQAQVWYRLKNTQEWKFAASGYNSVTVPNVEVGEEYTIAVCSEDIYGVCVKPENAPQTVITIITKAVTPNAPENVSITAKDKITISWDFVSNADIRYYEVRLDSNPGIVSNAFLGRTTSNILTVSNIPRSATVYVYAYGIANTYSQPGLVEYSFPPPAIPGTPELSPLVGGFAVHGQMIPAPAYLMKVYVSNGDSITSASNLAQYNCEAGIYFVSYTFIDAFGESPRSSEATITVKSTIDPGLIEAGSIGSEKLDRASQEALSKARNGYSKQETENAITSAFTEFENGELKKYSTITQMNDSIQLAVKDVDIDGNTILTKINLTDGTIKLDGKLTHITGDTLIDNNLITQGMIQSGAVTTDKLATQEIALHDQLNIRGGAVVLSDKGLKVSETNGEYSLFNQNGITFYDKYNRAYAAVKRQVIGSARDGQYVRFTNPWPVVPKVICSPVDLTSYVNSYDGFNTIMQCFAYNVTTTGFNVRCRAILAPGTSGGVIPINLEYYLGGTLETYYDSGHATFDYEYPVSFKKGVELVFNVHILATGVSENQDFYMPGYTDAWGDYRPGYWESHYVHEENDAWIELWSGGAKLTSSEVLHGVNSNAEKDLAIKCTVPNENAKITIKCCGIRKNTNQWAGSGTKPDFPKAHATFNIVSLESAVKVETVASTGTASFIAVDNSDSGYTIE